MAGVSLTGAQYAKTVAAKLIPVADKVRDVATKLGMRRYRVFIVTVRYSGFRRGNGVAQTDTVRELLPMPVVTGFQKMEVATTQDGVIESGAVVVRGVSGTYTEDQLCGYSDSGEPPDKNAEVFYEVEELPLNGVGQGDRVRFTLVGRPVWNVNNLEWILDLQRAQGDRNRDGTPRETTRII